MELMNMTNRVSGSRLSGNMKGVYWKTQLPIDYIDTTLTINDWETVDADLSEGLPTRLWYMYIEQTNNGAAAEDIELELTINGTAYTWSVTANSGTRYFCIFSYNLSAGDLETAVSTSILSVMGGLEGDQTCPFTAESISLIRTRQTTAVDGVSAQIEVNIVWDKLKSV